jgi:hypothetical protein
MSRNRFLFLSLIAQVAMRARILRRLPAYVLKPFQLAGPVFRLLYAWWPHYVRQELVQNTSLCS